MAKREVTMTSTQAIELLKFAERTELALREALRLAKRARAGKKMLDRIRLALNSAGGVRRNAQCRFSRISIYKSTTVGHDEVQA